LHWDNGNPSEPGTGSCIATTRGNHPSMDHHRRGYKVELVHHKAFVFDTWAIMACNWAWGASQSR